MEQTAKKQKQEVHDPKTNNRHEANRLLITYYTDPLCCWSWAFDKHLMQLQHEFGNRFTVRYVMAGMIRNWDSYSDPYNIINRPMQMGPLWMQAAQVTHTSINFDIWHRDPPDSSYPACLAVKTASLQSPEAEAFYLYKVREAVMTRQLNIAKYTVLFQIAEELETSCNNFSAEQFKTDWQEGKARTLFRKDLELAAFHKIGRYPTLTCTGTNGEGIIMVGYRPYEVLLSSLQRMGL
ncbi:MAG TPA: DsbA family protein [Ohtaekwangia sp.]|uniref:DsbA family protein n=1 Tax=Ohtaekwangia sp. TaxID=2066019 RepID=UPI002F95C7E1